jgi:hypothetical protein
MLIIVVDGESDSMDVPSLFYPTSNERQRRERHHMFLAIESSDSELDPCVFKDRAA